MREAGNNTSGAAARGANRRDFLKGTAAIAAGAPVLLAPHWSRSGAPTTASKPLRLGVNGDVSSFNPFQLSHNNYIFTANIYDTLLRYDKSLKARPRMAASWKIASDNSSITLNLRKGLTFQGGGAVDAAAIDANLKAAENPTTGLNVYPFAAFIRQVSEPSAGQVKIDFTQALPSQSITDIMATMPIADPAHLSNLKSSGAGAGPFSFKSWTPATSLDLSKFNKFWEAPKPYLPSVAIQIFSDPNALVSALESGQLDMIAFVPPSYASRLKGRFNLTAQTPPAQTYDVRLNPTRAPFTNKAIRQGMQYAVDRASMAKKILYGFSEPTVLPFSQASAANDKSLLTKYKFNLKKAKQMFAASGQPNWSSEILVTSTYIETVQMSQLLQADLKSIGVNLRINEVDLDTFNSLNAAGNYSSTFSFSGVANKYPSWITLSGQYRVVNNPLWGSAIPADYTSAMSAVGSAITESDQHAAFQQLRNALMDESWVVDVAYNPSLTASTKSVSGVGFTVDGWLALEAVKAAKSSG